VRAAEEAGEAIADRELAALFSDFTEFRRIVLAVSGGPDSMALLQLVQRWRGARRDMPALVVATVDHRLRPESRREAAMVARFAKALGLKHCTLVWSGAKPKTGVQEAAREARYRLLVGLARRLRADAMATAHTLDDQAETVLMRMARGSGIAGLGGIRPRGRREGIAVLRPLLSLPKSRLVASLRRAGVVFAEDSSNLDPRYARVRLRKLAADLAAEGLDRVRLATLARRLARADRALESVTGELERAIVCVSGRPERAVEIDARSFFLVPEEISLRLLARALDRVGDEGPVELGKLEALHSALRDAQTEGNPLRRTLAGGLVSLESGRIGVVRAPARGGGRRRARVSRDTGR
jgi:tRNA(Ile)-lysidine synthase